MPREDWRERDEARRRDRDDFGQADYSGDYSYDPRTRSGYRTEEDARARRRTDDYGQADYTTDWAYDPERGRPYRRYSRDEREDERRYDDDDDRRPGQPRSWVDKAGDFLAGRPRHEHEHEHEREHMREREREHEYADEREADREARRRRDGPSDRVLWAVIMERLDDERRLDTSDVEVVVHDAEVTLNGTVRRKADKRRIEDIADIDGVRNVQNNLRPRDVDRRWTIF